MKRKLCLAFISAALLLLRGAPPAYADVSSIASASVESGILAELEKLNLKRSTDFLREIGTLLDMGADIENQVNNMIETKDFLVKLYNGAEALRTISSNTSYVMDMYNAIADTKTTYDVCKSALTYLLNSDSDIAIAAASYGYGRLLTGYERIGRDVNNWKALVTSLNLPMDSRVKTIKEAKDSILLANKRLVEETIAILTAKDRLEYEKAQADALEAYAENEASRSNAFSGIEENYQRLSDTDNTDTEISPEEVKARISTANEPLFNLVYLIGGILAVLFTVIAIIKINKGEKRHEDVLFKVGAGFLIFVTLMELLKIIL